MLILSLFVFFLNLSRYTFIIYTPGSPLPRADRTQFRLQSNIEISRIDVLGLLDGKVDLQRRIV